MSRSEEVRDESHKKTKGELVGRKLEVFSILQSEPEGLTAWELAERTGRLVHAVRPRLTELREDGLIEPVGKRYYKPTDRRESVWRMRRGAQGEML